MSIKYLKQKIAISIQAIKYSLNCVKKTSKGQSSKYEILMTAHRLEKGLLNDKPKPFWGWEKAERIVSLLKVSGDEFSNRTGRGVLKAYIEAKKNSNNAKERERANKFLEQYPEIAQEDTLGGGHFC